MVDIDGVVSLFGIPESAAAASAAAARQPCPPATSSPSAAGSGEDLQVEGNLHSIDGIPHFLSSTAATHLLALVPRFELVSRRRGRKEVGYAVDRVQAPLHGAGRCG